MNRTTTSPKSQFTFHHFVIFWLTFIAYSLFHASRKTFSNVKTTLSDEWTASCDLNNHTCEKLEPDSTWNRNHFFEDRDQAKFYLGILDAIFLAAYSLGLFISGILGDRFDLRYVLTIGMTLSAASMFFFGVLSEWLQLYSIYWYVIFWIINGFAQSTGWPAVVAVMGNWFGKAGRGLIFGIWSACASVGNILGALMASSVLKYGYHYTFLFSSAVLLAGAVVTFFGLIPTPREIGLPEADSEEDDEEAKTQEEVDESDKESENQPIDIPHSSHHQEEKHHAIGFFQALLLPGVIMYSLCYACLKMVNYSFLFWLPFYLTNKFHWTESDADKLSIWYDVGGIFGGIIGGLISDLIRKRSVVIFFLLLLALPSLYVFSESTNSRLLNAVLMTIVGFFVSGAANMISATITADLGKQGPIQGNTEALSTVTGIVDGTGSVGAAIGQILVPLIQNNLDWFAVFYFFIALCVLTNVCIIPLFIREMKELCCNNTRASRATLYSTINADSDSDSNNRPLN